MTKEANVLNIKDERKGIELMPRGFSQIPAGQVFSGRIGVTEGERLLMRVGNSSVMDLNNPALIWSGTHMVYNYIPLQSELTIK